MSPKLPANLPITLVKATRAESGRGAGQILAAVP